MITERKRLFVFAIAAMLVFAGWPAGNDVYGGQPALVFPVQASHGMVVTGETLATKAGVEVLKKGGNAVDAPVTAAFVDYDMNIQEAVNAPKVHHEWLPDELRIEKGISPDTIRILQEIGYSVVVGEPMGAASSIMVDQATGMRCGAADPRRDGLALGY